MKSYSLLTLLLSVVIAALVANTIRLSRDLDRSNLDRQRDLSKVLLLHVQLMDQVLVKQEGKQLDMLLGNPNEWLAPLKEMINNDSKLSFLIRNVAIKPIDSNDPNEFWIYCNPVDDSPEPVEVFTLRFSGDKCVDISRSALCPW
jgi:hypothetical protein